ncbi:selenocysteine lyase isoform X5 [Anser cygnoides]|uniref:selenocysteine lyase isoform X5 n=1 Tax=Anser cygnoides TaxID=8845 RepID=UPI0034D3533E
MGAGTEPPGPAAGPAPSSVYLDYNATTPLAPEVAQALGEAACQAWGNPSSAHPAGRKAKELIAGARESLARMVGGRPEDVVFTSGGTEANNMVIHTALRHFRESKGQDRGTPHIVTSSVEHDSIRLPLEQLVKESLAEATFVPVSPRSGQAEVDDVLAAVRPTTCLVSIMLANNETGVIMFYGPRIGALYVHGPGTTTPLHPMLFGGGQERSFRPGTENTPMIAGLGKAAELVSRNWEAYEAHMRDVRDYLEARLESCPQPSDSSRHPLGSRGSTSTASSRAPSDCATPATSPSLAQAFKALLNSAQLWDPLRRGAERPAAERGAGHHPCGRGRGCAGPRAGCGTAGRGPSLVAPRTRCPAVPQVLGLGFCSASPLGAGCMQDREQELRGRGGHPFCGGCAGAGW